MKDLLVIGGGAAALSASIYAVRSGMDVKLVTKGYGGQINNTDVVENYLGIKSVSGPDLSDKFVEHMREYDVEEETNTEVVDIRKEDNSFEVETEDGDVLESYSVIIATGGHRRRLNVPGEEEYLNKGVAYCAVCDGPLYRDETVAVIGGGYAGTEAALYLSDIAEKVYIINIGEDLSGEAITINEVKDQDNIEPINNAQTKEIYGDEMVTGLKYEKDGEEHELDVTGVFIEIGTVPNSEFVEDLQTTDGGYIKVNEDMETGKEGLYAAGDVNNKGVQQLVVSAGEGCQAALNASDYVKEQKSKE